MKRSLIPAVYALPAVLVSGAVHAHSHYGIISTASTSPRAAARLNVTVIEGSGGITFTVFPPDGSAPVQDALGMSPEFFVTSAASTVPGIQNLFTGSGGESALIRVEYPDSSVVVLEQSSPEDRVVVGLPPVADIAGPVFRIPIGDLHRGTTLLIGNPTSQNNAIIIRYGQGAEEPPVGIAPFGVVVLPVTVANTQLRVRTVDTSLPVIAQLAVDTGKTTVMTVVPPLVNP